MKVNPQDKNYHEQIQKLRKPYVEIAEGMERQFTNYLLDQMKRGIPKDESSSSAREFYESQLDGEFAEAMSKSDTGLGVKNVILEQILPPSLKKQPGLNREAQKVYNQMSGLPTNRPPSKELRDE